MLVVRVVVSVNLEKELNIFVFVRICELIGYLGRIVVG